MHIFESVVALGNFIDKSGGLSNRSIVYMSYSSINLEMISLLPSVIDGDFLGLPILVLLFFFYYTTDSRGFTEKV